MKLVITSTPKSITIADSDNNRISVAKTTNGLEFHSSITSPLALMVQNKIKAIVLNPSDSKDNYKVRFSRLSKALTDINKPTLRGLVNSLNTMAETAV